MLRAAAAAARRFCASSAPVGLNLTSAVRTWGDPSNPLKMAGLEGALLTAGNPLLDLLAVVPKDVLDRYGVRGRL